MTDHFDIPPTRSEATAESAGQRTRRPRGVIIVTLGLAIGLPVAAIVTGVVLLVSLFGAAVPNATKYAGKPNTAEQTAKPIMAALHRAGGSVICEDGDPGFGFLDNTQPWYTAYVEVSDPDAGRDALLTAAQARGLALRAQVGSHVTDPNFDLTSAPVIVTDESSKKVRLDVQASTHAAVDLDCDGFPYDTPKVPKPDEAIYVVRVTEPFNTL